MQTKFLKYTPLNNLYTFNKRVLEIIVSISMLVVFLTSIPYFLIRKIVNKERIFRSKKFFLNHHENIDLTFFNVQNIFIKTLPLYFFILRGRISLVGVTLLKYSPTIQYKVEYKPGLFNLWFIRKNSKLAAQTISSCNQEYINTQSFNKDLKIISQNIISCLYLSKSKVLLKKVRIFDVSFDNLQLNEVLNFVQESIQNKTQKSIFFVNADCLNKSIKDTEYKNILNKSDLVLADGSGVNLACNILNTPLKENLNGTDLFPHLCELSEKKKYTIYLLGAKENIAKKMKKELHKQFPNLNIIGTHHGYFNSKKEEQKAIQNINELNPDILFVAMGAPVQEKFVEQNKQSLKVNIIFAVGGLFDFYSNNIKRAPQFLRETGFEWVYRMIQEPKRMWKRYILGNPLFLFRVVRYKKQLEKENIIDTYLDNYARPNSFRFKSTLWKISLNIQVFLKRAMDIGASFILILLFSPLFIVVSFIIKLGSKGDIFFIQKRVGLKGELFNMYKFRSMIVNAEELKETLANQNQSKDGVIFKMKDDPRITKVGKFIRKTSIDELPQLLNVLKGDMSLVGPRPPVINEVQKYNSDDKKRLDTKPGITCIWQVSGRSTIPFKEQVKMDKEYIKNQSLWMDIVLLFKTIPAVLFQKGSY